MLLTQATLQATHRRTPAPYGTLAAPAALPTEATFHNSCIWVGHVILAIGEPDWNHHFSNQPRNEPSPIRQHGRCTENSNWEKKNLRSCAHEPNCVTSQQRARQCQTSSAEIFTECEGSRCDTANVKTDNLIFQVCGMLNIWHFVNNGWRRHCDISISEREGSRSWTRTPGNLKDMQCFLSNEPATPWAFVCWSQCACCSVSTGWNRQSVPGASTLLPSNSSSTEGQSKNQGLSIKIQTIQKTWKLLLIICAVPRHSPLIQFEVTWRNSLAFFRKPKMQLEFGCVVCRVTHQQSGQLALRAGKSKISKCKMKATGKWPNSSARRATGNHSDATGMPMLKGWLGANCPFRTAIALSERPKPRRTPTKAP